MIELNDRVTNGTLFGTVVGIFNEFLWVLVDGDTQPISIPAAVVTLVDELTLEVGKSYKQPNGTDIYHVVAQLPNGNFVFWTGDDIKGYTASIAFPTQRQGLIEV